MSKCAEKTFKVHVDWQCQDCAWLVKNHCTNYNNEFCQWDDQWETEENNDTEKFLNEEE